LFNLVSDAVRLIDRRDNERRATEMAIFLNPPTSEI
jgi:hypothetical protein